MTQALGWEFDNGRGGEDVGQQAKHKHNKIQNPKGDFIPRASGVSESWKFHVNAVLRVILGLRLAGRCSISCGKPRDLPSSLPGVTACQEPRGSLGVYRGKKRDGSESRHQVPLSDQRRCQRPNRTAWATARSRFKPQVLVMRSAEAFPMAEDR